MTALAFPMVVGALALAAGWLVAAVSWPVGTALVRRFPALARGLPALAMVPWLVAAGIVMAAFLPGDPHLDQATGCHCDASMPGWAHLCPVHPGEAAAWVPLALGLLAALLPGRLRAWRQLARAPRGRGHASDGPALTPMARPMAGIVGWFRPTVVVDPRLWDALSDDERRAMLAHEQAHLARRDPAVLMGLRVLASLGPRCASAGMLGVWLDRAEHRADALAARAVGDPLLVAQALVRCARLIGPGSSLAPAWTGGAVERRVQALLDDDGAPVSATPDAGLVDVGVVLVGVAAALVGSPWVHHHVEHLINVGW